MFQSTGSSVRSRGIRWCGTTDERSDATALADRVPTRARKLTSYPVPFGESRVPSQILVHCRAGHITPFRPQHTAPLRIIIPFKERRTHDLDNVGTGYDARNKKTSATNQLPPAET